MNSRAPARWQADAALALVAIVWGSTFVVVKAALADISTFYFLFLRFSLASLCMLAVFLPAFRKLPAAELRRGLLGGAVVGLFLWLGYILQTFGLKYTSAGNSGFLTGLYIVLVPLIGAVVFRRRPSAREFAGIALAGLGMTVMTLPSLRNFSMNRGDVLTIGCAVAFAFQLLVLGFYSQREKSVEAVALGQIAAAAVLSGASLLLEPPRAVWSGAVVFGILLTAILATALAFALQTWGQKYTTPARAALIFSLEPVVALVTAVVLGGESLTRYTVTGGALILAGILVVELKSSPAKASILEDTPSKG